MSRKLPQNCCPVFIPLSTSQYSILSLTRMTPNHPFYTSNSVVRASINNFFHLTKKNQARGGAAITINHVTEDNALYSPAYDRLFTHSKLFADACLLAESLHEAVVVSNNKGRLPRGDYSSSPPIFEGQPEDGSCNIAINLPPGYDFCVSLLAVWLAKCRAVPLNVNATDAEIDHILRESETKIVISSEKESSKRSKRSFLKTKDITSAKDQEAKKITSENTSIYELHVDFESNAEKSLTRDHRRAIHQALQLEAAYPTNPQDDALLVATSGTTGLPKLAVHSHSSVSNQVNVLLRSWEWSSEDSLLHTLPLHHVHGLVNGVCCGLAASANIEFLIAKKFDPAFVVSRLESGDVSLFFSVPNAYKKLVSYFDGKSEQEKHEFKEKLKKNMRLFVSGSSALPVPVLEAFEQLSGQKMLERYGATEFGMALSQPLNPPSTRIPGTVGKLLPTVEMKLTTTHNNTADDVSNNNDDNNNNAQNYNLLLRSGSMFTRYWGKEHKTEESFIIDEEDNEWFDTGDSIRKVAVVTDEGLNEVHYAIQGRSSVDILKVSGYKISAVEIENALLNTGLLEECAVFSLNTSGNITEDGVVTAVITPSSSSSNLLDEKSLVAKLREELSKVVSKYKRPQKYILEANGIERNAMGKVNKKALIKKYSSLSSSSTASSSSSLSAEERLKKKLYEDMVSDMDKFDHDHQQQQEEGNNKMTQQEQAHLRQEILDGELNQDSHWHTQEELRKVLQDDGAPSNYVKVDKNQKLNEKRKRDEKLFHQEKLHIEYKGSQIN